MATIETVLENIGEKRYVPLFNENELDLEILLRLTELELKDALTELIKPIGPRMKIFKELQSLTSTSTETQSQIKTEEAHVHPMDLHARDGNTANETQSQIKTGQAHGHPMDLHARDGNTANVYMDLFTTGMEGARESLGMSFFHDSCHSLEGFPEEEIRIVLLGKTGSGKSATGNSILGFRAFRSTLSEISVTRKCSQTSAVRFNKNIVVIDTPGIFDTKETKEHIEKEIGKCVTLSSPGPHAFILVIDATHRFTEEENRTINQFTTQFGDDIYKYFIVVFSRKDELDRNKMSLKDLLRNSPLSLKLFVEKCGGRAIAFDNTLKDLASEKQAKALFTTILENVERNGGNYYTDEIYQKAENHIQEIKRIKKREQQEKREKEIKEIEEKIEKFYREKTNHELERMSEDIKKKLEHDLDTARLVYERKEDRKILEEIRNDVEQDKLKTIWKVAECALSFLGLMWSWS